MAVWLALFRGINVGGKHIVPMKPLTELMTQAGCSKVKSYIQSGNVVFQHETADKTALSVMLSQLVAEHFGFCPKVMVLSAAEFSAITSQNPFLNQCEQGKNLHVFFLESAATSADLAALASFKQSGEQFHLTPHAFYLHAPEGIGRSKLVTKIDKCLGVASTARNLNTLEKLSELINQLS